ncbi:FAD-binding protein [Rhodococcus sp. NPDC127530]|uniref:FAD-binding protein n=1 Tax=unclassified Rhodococcus (in: high G+C Gram-positive bacteria) TaxID=192944 RepID=UPI00362DF7CF
MTQEWDITTDLLVAGTGAAALAAAIAAADDGKQVLVVESTDKWGGTTFISGGGVWLPDNPVMQREGVRDSKEEALKYLESVVHDVGPASSRVRKVAFLNGVADSVSTLEKHGVEFIRSKVYPDYFSHKPGGSRGRSLDVKAFDIKKLGDYYASTRHDEVIPLPLQLDDFAELALGVTSPRCIKRALRVGGRIAHGVLTRRKLRGMGVALSCALMHVVRQQGTPVWLNAPITRLIIEDGAAVGAIVNRDGNEIRVRATSGVFLGTGGFGRNAEWRKKYHGHPGWSTAAEGDVGTGIQVGIEAGADTALMELAWGTPAIPFPGDNSRGVLLIWERSMPHSITIDQHGKRYINEALPYAEFVQGVLDHNAEVPCVPSWIVTDRRHTKKYVNLASTVGIGKLKQAGTIVDAPTLRELAQSIGVPPDDLEATVARFNELVRKGVDEDFHRGENEYENYYGDPTYPNPNLGELSVGPFRALKMMPGDLGTKGGLLTDEHARVLDTSGQPIAGLYASGNATASVMGQSYPGAGGTLGPALVFGFIGGRHASRRAA